MAERDKAIALLDSGVGGLTLMRELNRQLPKENIIYFGDTARMPYGPRRPEEVRRFALEIMEFLHYSQDIKILVVACNTATAVGLEHYRAHFDIPVLGVLEPGVRAALAVSESKRIGVIGTEGTIASKAYPNILAQLEPAVEVFDKACPIFVLLVENQLVDTPEAKQIAHSYLDPLKDQGIDALILGCTHYPLMEDTIVQVMGEGVKLVNSAYFTAQGVGQQLADLNLLRLEGGSGWQRFFVSGESANFEQIGARWLGYPVRAYRVTF
jgi:glutamate racemase